MGQGNGKRRPRRRRRNRDLYLVLSGVWLGLLAQALTTLAEALARF